MIKISRESFSALVNLNSGRHESPLENSVTIFNEFSFPLTEPRIITIATNLTSILDLLLRSSSPVAMTQDQRRWNRRFPLLSPPRSKPWTRGQRRFAAPPSFLPQLAPNWSILFCGSFFNSVNVSSEESEYWFQEIDSGLKIYILPCIALQVGSIKKDNK